MNETVELANLYNAGVKGYNRMNGSIISADGISNIVVEPAGFYTNQTGEDRFRKPMNGLSRTLKAEQHDAGVVIGNRIRKLTPLECWRLMGFDDADHERAEKAGVSNSQRYKQAGNSIVVNVLEAIFSQML